MCVFREEDEEIVRSRVQKERHDPSRRNGHAMWKEFGHARQGFAGCPGCHVAVVRLCHTLRPVHQSSHSQHWKFGKLCQNWSEFVSSGPCTKDACNITRSPLSCSWWLWSLSQKHLVWHRNTPYMGTIASSPGMWEETGHYRGNPHGHEENMQRNSTHRVESGDAGVVMWQCYQMSFYLKYPLWYISI